MIYTTKARRPVRIRKLGEIGRCSKVMLVRERADSLPSRRIRGPRDVFEIVAPEIGDAAQEHLVALTLDTQLNVKTIHTITVGSLDASISHPREIFLRAIADCSAAIILAHNHPSGEPTPSQQDREATARIVAAGRIVGISVLDHVVIGDERYSSFVEMGFMRSRSQYRGVT